jgi:pimeloyl-ACP methyl ester carboxylesterase
VIIFHGNAGSANSRLFYLHALQKLNYRVILAEYPGYAARPGSPTEESLLADTAKTLQLAYAEFGAPLLLWGESLGSGVAAGVVQHSSAPIQGMALLTPFDSLANTAQHHYGFFLAKWLLRDKFDNVKNLAGYTGNIAIIQANKDQVIPNKRTQKLFTSLVGNKRIWQFEQAGHNTIPVSDDLLWWQEVMDFLTKQP